MLYRTPLSMADIQTVNSIRNVIAPRQPVRRLRSIVYLYSFMIVQYTVNSYEYNLQGVRFACFTYVGCNFDFRLRLRMPYTNAVRTVL